MNKDQKWMQIAIDEAKSGQYEGEVPVGAIIIKDEEIIARAHNQPILKNDATAHAEIQVIRKAGKFLNNYRITETSIYVTLEPCSMCLGAIINARIPRLIFGAKDNRTFKCNSTNDLKGDQFFNHNIEITSGILEKECSQLLKDFFKELR
jgi:tRNA(adenine34) deaminase